MESLGIVESQQFRVNIWFSSSPCHFWSVLLYHHFSLLTDDSAPVLMVITGVVSYHTHHRLSTGIIFGDEYGFPSQATGVAALCLSFTSNIWATILIGYKAWRVFSQVHHCIELDYCAGYIDGALEDIYTVGIEGRCSPGQ